VEYASLEGRGPQISEAILRTAEPGALPITDLNGFQRRSKELRLFIVQDYLRHDFLRSTKNACLQDFL
jgi:hypothetical protein